MDWRNRDVSNPVVTRKTCKWDEQLGLLGLVCKLQYPSMLVSVLEQGLGHSPEQVSSQAMQHRLDLGTGDSLGGQGSRELTRLAGIQNAWPGLGRKLGIVQVAEGPGTRQPGLAHRKV